MTNDGRLDSADKTLWLPCAMKSFFVIFTSYNLSRLLSLNDEARDVCLRFFIHSVIYGLRSVNKQSYIEIQIRRPLRY